MTTAPSWLCLACGAWQGASSGCQVCRSTRLASGATVGRVDERTGTRIDGGAVRVLVDVEARSDGALRATRVYTDRLSPIRGDAPLLAALQREVDAHLDPRALADATRWAALHVAVRGQVEAAVDALLRPRWPGRQGAAAVPVELSLRVLQLNPWAALPGRAFPWLEVVPIDAGIVRAGANLRPGDVRAKLFDSKLSLDEGGDRLRVALHVPVEVLVEELLLCPTNHPSVVLAKLDASTFLPRDRWTPVLDQHLPAFALWKLSAQPKEPQPGAEIRARLRGAAEPTVLSRVPCGDLGGRDTLVDVFLDLGSTTTKYIVRVGGRLSAPRAKGTAKLAEEWSLPRYDKAKVLADPSGREWATWIAGLLPALRRYAAREHCGHFRSVHLTIPQAGALDVAALARAASAGEPPSDGLQAGLDAPALSALHKQAVAEAVGFATGGQVVILRTEHEAVAAHYLSPLRVLHQAAAAYHRSFDSLQAERAHQRQRQAAWDQKRAKRQAYDDSSLWRRVWDTKPEGPSGARPEVKKAPHSPADWMRRLVEHPELLERVVLLDAGGLSVDIAVLESNVLVPACSKSDAHIGGEAITRALGRRIGTPAISSEQGTNEKARLGALWADKHNSPSLSWDERFGLFGGRSQRAYREVTRELCAPPIHALAEELGQRWAQGGSRQCTVLLTGGGSRNPHFEELIGEQFAASGLEPLVMDARGLQELLDEARAFPHPLPELASPAVVLFSTVKGWTWVSGSERNAYDKFAVVGGLLAGAQRP
jgi:hypothetical protein